MDHLCYFCIVLFMLSSLFIPALWSSAGKGLTSWLLFVMFNCVFFLAGYVNVKLACYNELGDLGWLDELCGLECFAFLGGSGYFNGLWVRVLKCRRWFGVFQWTG